MARETIDGRVDGETETDRYRHLIEHVQDAVVEFDLVDGDPVVSDVNRAFVDVFGYDATRYTANRSTSGSSPTGSSRRRRGWTRTRPPARSTTSR
ncbi:PAS domain-containing protein [Halorubrum saccharovorum]|uniref:PAS domain-containing protein n=1 Tax=Halorubrum saccharovorum TaxID=2248 RepID=UPI001F16BDC9|nr:PAS domain-containing protein [Halorubrum saccharovorum]